MAEGYGTWREGEIQITFMESSIWQYLMSIISAIVVIIIIAALVIIVAIIRKIDKGDRDGDCKF